MNFDEFYDKVWEYVAVGQNAIVNSYLPDGLKRRIIDTALEVERTLENERGDWDKTPLCDEVIEYAWKKRTEEEMEQERLTCDDVEYIALIDEERNVYIDNEKYEDFLKNNFREFLNIENRVDLIIDIFEEGNSNEIQTENGILYEVYWDTYMGHDIRVERRIKSWK